MGRRTLMESSVLALVMCAFFIAQTVKGVTGFGAGLVSMPVLLAVLPPEQAILLLVSVDLVTGLWLVKDVRKLTARRLITTIMLTMTLGQWIGTEILFSADASFIAKLLGVVVLLMGARFTWRPVVPGRGEMPVLPRVHRRLLAQSGVAGMVSGLMRGTVGAGGPPLVLFMRYHFQDGFARAQLLTVTFLGSVIMAIMLVAKGADTHVLQLTPFVLIPGLLGSRMGAWLAGQVSREVFGRATGLILVLAGMALILK